MVQNISAGRGEFMYTKKRAHKHASEGKTTAPQLGPKTEAGRDECTKEEASALVLSPEPSLPDGPTLTGVDT